jgi:hypothetical protein
LNPQLYDNCYLRTVPVGQTLSPASAAPWAVGQTISIFDPALISNT